MSFTEYTNLGMADIKRIVGRNINRYRNEHCMTLKEIGVLVGCTGVMVRLVECGLRGFRYDKMLMICNCFKITIDKLFEDANQNVPDGETQKDRELSRFILMYNYLPEKDRLLLMGAAEIILNRRLGKK